jgi:hypothetical protein
MRKLMIATAAATALLAGASVANAQTFYSDGYVGSDYYYGRPMIDRGVGLQIGPFGAGVYADTPEWGYARTYGLRGDHPQSTYNSRAFRSQEVWPQSPPGGG